MSCEVAALPFHAHANYGTWSVDFGSIANFDNIFWNPVIRSFVHKFCRLIFETSLYLELDPYSNDLNLDPNHLEGVAIDFTLSF